MEAKYYILKPAVNTPETGNAFPAADSYDDYDFKAPNSVHKLKYNEFPDFEPDIRFKLKHGAKLTDMLSQAAISAHGFLISTRLKEFFCQFNIVPHKFYPAKIEAKAVIHEYWWMHLAWQEGIQYVNFINTNFNITEFGDIIEPISICSYSELIKKQEELGVIRMIYAPKISMRKTNLDFFFNPINTGIYISDSIKDLLIDNKYTGISIEINNGILFD